MIRKLEIKDSQNLDLVRVLVYNINNNYSETEKEFWGLGVERTSVENFQNEILSNTVLVYFEDDQPLGTVVYKVEEGAAMFGMLSVNLDQHGKGIGSLLYEELEKQLIDQNISRLKLEILVPRLYESSYKNMILNWYLRIGYKIYERVETEGLDYFPYQNLLIKSDFIRMEKKLP